MAQLLQSTQELEPDLVDLQDLYRHEVGPNQGTSPVSVLSAAQIRLLKIHSPFSFSLTDVFLKDEPRFVALSYQWGTADDLFPVVINNREFKIRRHVYKMLRRIYYTHREICVWIDMLCINQSCKKEKREQIHLMSSVFGKADRVYAWLGEQTPESDIVFDVIKAFSEQKREDKCPYTDPCLALEWHRDLFMRIYESEAGELPSRDSKGDFLIKEEFTWIRPLYSREYWTRLWIVQELILAKEVVICCGTKSVGLDDIYGLSLDWGSFGQAFDAGTYVEPHRHTIGWNTIQAIRDHRRIREKCCNGQVVMSPQVCVPLDEIIVLYAKQHDCKEKKENLHVKYVESDKSTFRRVAELGLFDSTHHGGWGLAWYLWDAMQLGPFNEFKAFSKGYLSPEAHEAVSLAALQKRLLCEIPKGYSAEQIKPLRYVLEE